MASASDPADDINPDDSASQVTGASASSTRLVRASKRRAALEAKARIAQQKKYLESSLADEEYNALLAQLEHNQITERRSSTSQ